MKPELHVFIIWEKGRYLAGKILADIEKNFEIRQVYDMSWPEERFAANLAKFYGKNLPKSCRKERECGCGKFLTVVVVDHHPQYIQGLNLKMCEAKIKYRKWYQANLIHASDHAKEGIANLEMLTGLSAEQFLALHPLAWDGKTENRQADLAVDGLKYGWIATVTGWFNNVGRQLLQNLNLW